MIKLIRTIQLDPSDQFVFERAAEPGEWAVSGAFAFWNDDIASLEGKARSAFRSGFLGITSLGRSTLVQVVEARDEDRAAAVAELARQLVDRFGAPDLDRARSAAEDEIAFAAALCDQPIDTLIAVHRTYEDGELREAFRTLRQRGGAKPLRAFSFLEAQDDAESEDRIDLAALAERARE